MAIRAERLAVLAAVEAAYGVDETPTASAVLRDVTINDVEGSLVEVDSIRLGMGGRAKALHGRHVSLKGKIFLASSGAAGTAPAWDWLARCTAHAKTVIEDTQVDYTPIDTAQESASLYFNLEANRTRILGAKGGIIWRWGSGAFPEGEFDLLGLFDANANVAFPAVDFAAWKTPPLFGKDTVPNFKIAGNDEVMQSLEINSGISKEYSELINRRSIDITDRRASVTTTILEPPFATRIYQSTIGVVGSHKTVAMTHGAVAGAIVQAAVTNWQTQTFARTKISDKAGITLGGEIVPAAGVADYKITVK